MGKQALIGPWPDMAAARLFLSTLVSGREALHDRWEVEPSSLANWLIQHELCAMAYERCKVSWPALSTPLQTSAYRQMAQTASAFEQAVELVSELQKQGIESILLKGLALGANVFPAIQLRSTSDIDLLLRQSDIPPAVDYLKSKGYRAKGLEKQEGLTRVMHRHYPMLIPVKAGQVGVELHWTLGPAVGAQWSPDISWFWNRAIPFPVDKGELLFLDPIAHLLYLSFHLMVAHGLGRAILKWLADIHFLVTPDAAGESRWRIRDKDWDEVVQSAQLLGWSAAVYGALEAAQEFFGTFVPAEVLTALDADSDPQMRHLVLARSYSGLSRSQITWQLISMLKGKARWRALAAILCPSPEYMRWRYQVRPGWLWPVYYPYRWGSMVVDGVRTLGRWLRRKLSPNSGCV